MYVKKPGACSVDHRRARRFRPKKGKKIPPEKDADCTPPGGKDQRIPTQNDTLMNSATQHSTSASGT